MNLEKLVQAIEAMTPKPWVVNYPFHDSMAVPYIMTKHGNMLARTTHYGNMRVDAEGIALLRNVADELIACVRAGYAFDDEGCLGDKFLDAQVVFMGARRALDGRLKELLL